MTAIADDETAEKIKAAARRGGGGMSARDTPIDWNRSPPFITAITGLGAFEVHIKVHSFAELVAAHDLVLKSFSDTKNGAGHGAISTSEADHDNQ